MIFDSLIKDHRKLFWVLHLGGWLFWGLFVKYGYTTQWAEERIPWYFLYVMVITVM